MTPWRGSVFGQEAAGSCLQRRVHVLVEVERGDHDDRQRVGDVRPGELAGGLDAVHHGHADVEQAHAGPQLACTGDRLTAVAGLTDDVDVRLSAEQHHQPGVGLFAVAGYHIVAGRRLVRIAGLEPAAAA